MVVRRGESTAIVVDVGCEEVRGVCASASRDRLKRSKRPIRSTSGRRGNGRRRKLAARKSVEGQERHLVRGTLIIRPPCALLL
jgi:hypothetical protein